MRIFEAGQTVRVPFPYTDRLIRQRRPALVISARPLGRNASLIWVSMITSAENAGWPDDVAVSDDPDLTGLPIPSIVRPAKIATIDASDAEPVGQVSAGTLNAVLRAIRSQLA